MFIQEQMPSTKDMNYEMQDFMLEVTARMTPITAHMDGTGRKEYNKQIKQWDDMINSLLFV